MSEVDGGGEVVQGRVGSTTALHSAHQRHELTLLRIQDLLRYNSTSVFLVPRQVRTLLLFLYIENMMYTSKL